jgi:predicted enzyme related to lactoylglutathione lyase
MAAIDRHTPGVFCWTELGTTDAAAAKVFYSGLFGWTPDDMPVSESMTYTMLKLEGRELGALYQLSNEQRTQGVLPNWLLYVAVDNPDQIANTANELGGKILAGPFDVFDAGRMAVMQDPEGAVFAVWQAKNHIGARIGHVAGTLCWSELAAKDAAKAKDFYTKLFGWDARTDQMGPMRYTQWLNRGQPVGGMLQMTETWQAASPHWMAYFQVADCDSSAARAKNLGGQVMVSPMDVANVGRFAVLQDPQGAAFSVIRLVQAE